MISKSEQQIIMSGTWRFAACVEEAELIKAAEKLLEAQHGNNFIDLHIYKARNEELVLGFKYKLEAWDKKTSDSCFHKMRDMLERYFGKNLRSWTVSSRTRILRLTSI